MAELVTARLRLRMWRREDADAFAELNAQPEVMRYLRDGAPMSREDSDRLLDACEEHWRRHGFGLWAVELRGSGEFVGFTGLAYPTFLPEVMPDVEVGWRLAHRFWKRGYATEGGRAALTYGFDQLGLERVVSIARLDNLASRRVMEKLGMRPDREARHPELGTLLSVHAITRERWLAR